jgi:hypothetical protein
MRAHRIVVRRSASHACMIAGISLGPTSVCADVIPITPAETYDEFITLQPDVTRIDFADLGRYPATLTNQYAHVGVTFDATLGDWIAVSDYPPFEVDGFGARGLSSINEHDVVFSHPIQHFGLWNNGGASIELYDGSRIVAAFSFLTLEDGFFGFASDQAFDRIRFRNTAPSFDDIVFTTLIPAPGATVLVVVGCLCSGRRRRLK